ncbi:MAG: DUF2147 domain-containing protein [Cypionkella sp.]
MSVAVLLLALAGMATSSPQAGEAAAISGVWRTPVDSGSLVRLAPCGNDICGVVLDSPRLRANPAQTDERNTNAALRSRALKGLLILRASSQGQGRWGNGWVYNPEEGRTYRGSLRLLPDGRLTLTGCVILPLCKTQIWERTTRGV